MDMHGPFNGNIDPLPSFHSHAKNRNPTRVQYEGLKRVAEGLRTIGALITGEDCHSGKAHSVLDDLIKLRQSSAVRVADLHVREIGASHEFVKMMEDAGIYTIKDLSGCMASKMPASMDIMAALSVTLAALRRVVDLEGERG